MKSTFLVVPIAVALFVVSLSVAPSVRAQTETVLHSFSGADGQNPYSGLIADASGNLYGTTVNGGTSTVCPGGCGTVYELVNSSGTYTYRVLLDFTGGDGSNPFGNLLMDSSGNLYGTTFGGSTTATAGGTVFELVNSSGSYTEKILHIFKGNASGDGCAPAAGVIMDSSGNLYGTTSSCGASDGGTVFELVNSSGTYTEKVLHSFSATLAPENGYFPEAGLIMDSSGNLYGTTSQGGGFWLVGTVFELVNSSGTYTEKVLYAFGAYGDAAIPDAGLVMDSSGNLYGTTSNGGASASGAVFELANNSGSYTEKVLYSFTSPGTDGTYPYAGLIMDSYGDLFGTTSLGGVSGFGTVFELVKFPGGGYNEETLYSFTNTGGDGAQPQAGLIMDSSGNLFGTTVWGGASQWGTAFEVPPRSHHGWFQPPP